MKSQLIAVSAPLPLEWNILIIHYSLQKLEHMLTLFRRNDDLCVASLGAALGSKLLSAFVYEPHLLFMKSGDFSCADMEKFPVRMKDNDLLVTQLFEDPSKEPITALSVYITPNVCECSGRGGGVEMGVGGGRNGGGGGRKGGWGGRRQKWGWGRGGDGGGRRQKWGWGRCMEREVGRRFSTYQILRMKIVPSLP